MTPDEMRQYGRSSGNYVKTDIWEVLAELCERLDRIAEALKSCPPHDFDSSGPNAGLCRRCGKWCGV